MHRHIIGAAGDIVPGQRKIVSIGGREIGVINVRGRFYALRNICPHRGAPLCRGTVDGTTLPSLPGEHAWGRQGEVRRCPWHGWEFDISTGQALVEPRARVKSHQIEVEAGNIVLCL